MQPRTALAFAPAVISNFFAIHNESLSRRAAGPLSGRGDRRGVHPLEGSATPTPGSCGARPRAISVAVNGDASYPADTTRKAVELLLEEPRPTSLPRRARPDRRGPDRGRVREQLGLRSLCGDGGGLRPRAADAARSRSRPSRTRPTSSGTRGSGLSPPPTTTRARP